MFTVNEVFNARARPTSFHQGNYSKPEPRGRLDDVVRSLFLLTSAKETSL